MTKENENNSHPSSFRDQILRDLEELKAKRAAEQPEDVAHVVKQQVVEEVGVAETRPTDPEAREVVKIDRLAFPKSYVTEDGQETEEETVHLEEEQIVLPAVEPIQEKPVSVEPVEEPAVAPAAIEELLPPLEVEPVSQAPQQELQNTVERNLEELRNLVAASSANLPEPLEARPSDPVEAELAQDTTGSSPVLTEDTLPELPKEDFPAVREDNLEETIVAPKPPRVATSQAVVPTSQPRRRTHSKHKRKKQDKTAKRIVSVVMSLVIVALLATGIFGYVWVKSNLEPVNAQATETIQVEIPEGSSTLEIGKILVEHKLIKNATVFNYYSKIKSYNNFHSGFYNLTQSMSVDDIAKALQESGTPTAQNEPAGKILVVEGYTLNQIAQAVTLNAMTDDPNDTTPFTAEQFMATVTNPDFINRMVAAYPNLFASLPAADSGVLYQLEGYLFPAVYEYEEATTMEDIVSQMIAAMDARLQPYYETIAAKNLTVNEVLTLASLVEKEGSTDEDRRNIASVFFNRLNAEMPLQSNIAILYAQGKLGQETTLEEDTNIDTSIESPYNIYWRTGLMPGPVDSPSLSAIEATINANQTEYYYFVADVTTGTVYFATTIEEHDQNVATYVNAHLE